jgi:threonine/homoserine/homoserine lactone efflux protein
MDVIDSRFAAFVVVIAVLIITPGPDMALVTRNALSRGLRAGVFTALGVGVGILGWAIAVAMGVAGLLDRSPIAFHALKFAGAMYLVLLGFRALFNYREGKQNRTQSPERRIRGTGASVAFRQGVLGNVLNPKAGVIFCSIVPQFVAP